MKRPSSLNIIAFGDFTLNLRSGELSRPGRTVRLRVQSFRILVMLLENPGEVVTREEIQKVLWPNDTVVEFENSINSAVRRLRDALQESAHRPRFIETLAKRGYRFIGTVDAHAPQLAPPRLTQDDAGLPVGTEPQAQQDKAALESECAPAPVDADADADPVRGTQFTHYLLIEKIGQGGMGVVYRAEDTRLGRDVAIKFLPRDLAGNRRFLEWFAREARTASSLNHPNICTIHEVDEQRGDPFIVMELLDGETLKQRLAGTRPRFTLDGVLDVGLQITEGLAAAHARGIVHRDIKPANVFITSSGQAKILDFGLAVPAALSAAHEAAVPAVTLESGASSGSARTVSKPAGTPAYMSPEQASGGKVTASSDVYSLGCVLYEMIAGLPPANDDGCGEISFALLRCMTRKEASRKRDSVAWLQRVVSSALQPDARVRYQTAAEMAGELRRLKAQLQTKEAEFAARAAGLSFPARLKPLSALLASVIVAVLTLGSAVLYQPSRSETRIVNYSKITQRPIDDYASQPIGGPVCTDGSHLFYSGTSVDAQDAIRSPIFEVAVSGGVPVELSTTLSDPFLEDISPDGSMLLATDHSAEGTGFPLYTLPLAGGSARQIPGIRAHCAGFGFDGRQVVYVNGNGVYIVDKDGGRQMKLADLPSPAWWPRMSPDGKFVRFNMDGFLWEVPAEGGHQYRVFPELRAAHCCGSWSADGQYYLFRVESESTAAIWMRREKAGFFRWRRPEPVPLTSGPVSFFALAPSKDGQQLFASGGDSGGGMLARYDRASNKFRPYLGGPPIGMLSTSPDGNWICYVTPAEGALWRQRVDGTDRRQLSLPGMEVIVPRWSPDGSHIAFATNDGSIYIVGTQGGTPERIDSAIQEPADPYWSPDGTSIMTYSRKGGIYLTHVADHTIRKVPGSDKYWGARWSPDGRYIAAFANVDSVRTLVLFDFRSRKWTVVPAIKGSFDWMNWSHDSRYMYFRTLKEVSRLRISNQTIERVVRLEGRSDFSTMSGFSGWMGLAPDDSPIFLATTPANDIYRIEWARH